MKVKRALSLLLSLIISISSIPTVFSLDTSPSEQTKTASVTLTAQIDGTFLCAPQFDIDVSADTAEKYGFTDNVDSGVSVLDALVALHKIKYGEAFTSETASNYIAVSSGGTASKSFGNSERFSGFVLNGAFPNDGTESQYGGYNGTVETTQEIKDGDTVEFFFYSDSYSDEIAWLSSKGSAVTEITVLPESNVSLSLKSTAYMYAYNYKNADELHNYGSAVSGAQIAYIDISSGELSDIDGAVTSSTGDVSFTAPKDDGIYYITAYMPSTSDGEPIIMPLIKMTADKDYSVGETCRLSSLYIASFDSNPNALAMSPEFSSETFSYTVPAIDYPDMDIAVFRSVYVKAAAVSDKTSVTAECNGVSADIKDASNWTILNGALNGGENNVITITVAEGEKSVSYKVTAPMKSKVKVPKSLTLDYTADTVIDGTIISEKGGKFKLNAYDEDGNETPVVWKNTSYGGGGVTVDEKTGEAEITSNLYQGGTSYLYFTAESELDSSISKKITVKLGGFRLSDNQKKQTVYLSEDGQTEKKLTVSAGYDGHNIWSINIPDGIGELTADPKSSRSAGFNLFRPGTITASFKLDVNENLTDTVKIEVKGVAVEDENGARGKTYLSVGKDIPTPQVQLTAFCEEGKKAESWSSADESIAAVDENGIVTAKGVGSTIITVTDSDGTKGGIKAVVESEDIPYFENLEFSTTAFSSNVWVTGKTFSPTNLEYELSLKNYSVSTIMLTSSTVYDTDKYTAYADYTDTDGSKQHIYINSGKSTSLTKQPFGESIITITLSDIKNPDSKTVYTFKVNRPRDTTKAIKNGGITVIPSNRELSDIQYGGISEGTMLKCDENGTAAGGSGVSSQCRYYRTFIYSSAEKFKLSIFSSTAYARMRYFINDGEPTELPQGGGTTDEISLESCGTVTVQITDDESYTSNISEGKDGFDGENIAEYKIYIDKVSDVSPEITSAVSSCGDIYPAFSPEIHSYYIISGSTDDAPILSYTVSDGIKVSIGTAEQTPDSDGKYSLELKTSQTAVTLTSGDGSYSSTYKFAYKKKSALDVPDKVVDYLCIGSQYTNSGYGINPEFTLSGNLKSLGNFGGYITYYYDTPLTDNPNNKYGIDFYVIGNSSETNIDSMAELGQVYVSENGDTWYALAGSEHYEDNALWDYTITYTKTADGKSNWTDNYGNSNDYTGKPWPKFSYYPMNGTAKSDKYTFTGILFKCQDGTITGDSSSTGSFAAKAKFGYADYYATNISGGVLTDVNPYVEKPSKANGFDLAWAVDEKGTPVDVSEKEFHYVKIATASNIYAGSFAEKSTEITYVIRTSAAADAVGKTSAPDGVTISDGIDSIKVNFTENKTVYPINLGNMKYVSIAVNGTSDSDNIYINNQRVISGEAAEGFKTVKSDGEKAVRIIVQNGEKEPVIYLLKLTSTADDSDSLIDGIKISAGGTTRTADRKKDGSYTVSVGRKIDSISIGAVTSADVSVKINNDEPKTSYELEYGKNVFEITADNGSVSETAVLTVTREAPSSSSDKKINVKFTLYGDTLHGTDESHTYAENKKELPIWISKTTYAVTENSTVLELLETALSENGFSFENAGGNYISEINGLGEFDNGTLSGWLYTVNGKYPSLGVAEQTLKNGDNVVFHYTDDYTAEESSKNWQSGSASASKTNTYTVKFDSNGGSSVQNQKVEKNERAVLPDSPVKDGFVFDGWYSDSEFSVKYDFTEKVTSNITLFAKWTENADTDEPAAVHSFTDIEKDSWYEYAVEYTVKNNLFNGISETEFAPYENMTRAMLVTVLYRIEQPYESSAKMPFTDVENGEWYYDAVLWAYENGIANGIGENEFAPNENVTREQAVTILFRYAKYKGYKTDALTIPADYADIDEISGWAEEPFKWACGEKIISGTSQTSLSPKDFLTRAQNAVIIMRFCENIKN